jgi:hypothetical protein
LRNGSTDEHKYKYETYINPKSLEPSVLPGGGYSSEYYFYFYLDNSTHPPPDGKHHLMLKLYYGKGRMNKAAFSGVIPKIE